MAAGTGKEREVMNEYLKTKIAKAPAELQCTKAAEILIKARVYRDYYGDFFIACDSMESANYLTNEGWEDLEELLSVCFDIAGDNYFCELGVYKTADQVILRGG
jgi:hypothetical protein